MLGMCKFGGGFGKSVQLGYYRFGPVSNLSNWCFSDNPGNRTRSRSFDATTSQSHEQQGINTTRVRRGTKQVNRNTMKKRKSKKRANSFDSGSQSIASGKKSIEPVSHLARTSRINTNMMNMKRKGRNNNNNNINKLGLMESQTMFENYNTNDDTSAVVLQESNNNSNNLNNLNNLNNSNNSMDLSSIGGNGGISGITRNVDQIPRANTTMALVNISTESDGSDLNTMVLIYINIH